MAPRALHTNHPSRLSQTACALALALNLPGCAADTTGNLPSTGESRSVMGGVAIVMLSRGAGVPDTTRAAYLRLRALVDTERASAGITRTEESVIGLEGERRTCIAFDSDAAAQRMLARLQDAAAGVDLLQVTREDCAPR